jgi:hypothetical protein
MTMHRRAGCTVVLGLKGSVNRRPLCEPTASQSIFLGSFRSFEVTASPSSSSREFGGRRAIGYDGTETILDCHEMIDA